MTEINKSTEIPRFLTDEELAQEPPEILGGDNPEQEKKIVIPDWFKKAVEELSNAWFDPKSFELDLTLYEKLGVKKFKKYVPTSGDVVQRLIWKRLGDDDLVRPKSLESLRDMVSFTKFVEMGHLAEFAWLCMMLRDALARNEIGWAAFYAGLNMLTQVYPIMLQRYNRTRLYRTINKIEKRAISEKGIDKSI